ncbi:tryptophan 2,3-dioxygenase [Paraburkholderia sp. BL10I2N1]|uniref:tryptophan 2,3-dioxygenase n=1 Tax=Paraburkholderia sp. BL10I2N1 TaxID=1938796 RepID=UPI00105F34DF|nr:tryptophan 2,3-dioxygenase [Paraburkholderia sp. BL10I2N1]TDN62289.1 tryptophan 2,3-dioxygenase [Paraburkholderia sp. BL10I2N1]
MSCPFSGNEAKKESAVDGGWHNAQLDFASSMSYGDYLHLDEVLDAPHPLSPDHNEMLFIVQHQTSELWMKLMLHELRASRAGIRGGELQPVFKMLARVSRIMDQLVQAWSVLATMTPPEYRAMRPYLGLSSGFQSHQYREIEFLLGNKNPTMLRPREHLPENIQRLQEALELPSLYDESIRLLAHAGLFVEHDRLNADWTQPTRYNASVAEAWLRVYRNPKEYWDLYQLAEKLVDIEDSFRQWRFRHLTTVERVIGFKRGTGGTEGVGYLRKMLDVVLFPELWQARTNL